MSTQISHYSSYIQKNKEWIYVGVYADEGITGTTDKRSEFQRMIKDCEEGKIDIILTKSISRFARNTVDLLETVRYLKELGIEVRFESENISSLSDDGELMLTLLASFAQEESRSISENVKWGIRKGFKKGIVNSFCIYGYRWDGEKFNIVPEEAEVIKLIYDNFLNNMSAEETEKQLKEMGIKSYTGNHFSNTSIRAILRQEKYTGDSLLQKTYVENHITQKTVLNKGGNLVLNEEEALIIKRIYGMFLQGMTPYGIAKKLTEDGILTPAKKKNWSAGTVRSILTNEKYKGDALLQKSYTVDFLTKEKKINEGEIPQYYVENNHEAIIDPAVFDMVQRELEARQAGKNRHSGTHIFAGKIKCGQCGSWYGSKVWHSNSKYRRVVWQCNHKFSGDDKCTTPHLDEDTIKDEFINATNKLLEDKDEIIANFEVLEATAFNTDELEKKKVELQNELEIVADLIQNIINENAHTALDQEEYQKRYDSLVERFDATKANLELTTEQIKDKITRHKNLEIFLDELQKQDSLISEFDPLLWNSLVDYVTVYEKKEVQVTFKNGIKI